jgi:hypothetical protein
MSTFSPSLQLASRVFRLPKRGHRFEDCEDAVGADAERGRFAVADGATESGQSGAWARMLVHAFLQGNNGPLNWVDWLPPLQSRWLGEVETRLGPEPRLWFVDAQLEQGAFSTFLGLVIEPSGWYAQAVGDSCLFQVRGEDLIERYPVLQSADFGFTPWLVGSRTSAAGVPQHEGKTYRGLWKPGDSFWLMTDALAEWFLRQVERRVAPWQVLQPLLDQGHDAVAAWVQLQRDSGQLRNDDVALVRVSL